MSGPLGAAEAEALSVLLDARARDQASAVSGLEAGVGRLDSATLLYLGRQGMVAHVNRLDRSGRVSCPHYWLTALGVQRAMALPGGHG